MHYLESQPWRYQIDQFWILRLWQWLNRRTKSLRDYWFRTPHLHSRRSPSQDPTFNLSATPHQVCLAPLFQKHFDTQYFLSLHSLSHPGIRATQRLITASLCVARDQCRCPYLESPIPATRACATASAVMHCRGNASGQRVNRSMQVRRYVNPFDGGRGPTMSM